MFPWWFFYIPQSVLPEKGEVSALICDNSNQVRLSSSISLPNTKVIRWIGHLDKTITSESIEKGLLTIDDEVCKYVFGLGGNAVLSYKVTTNLWKEPMPFNAEGMMVLLGQ